MSQNDSTDDRLATFNSAAMGTTMPVVTLPDGQRVQTGTVGALIINIKLYDELMGQSKVDQERKAELETMITASVPVLRMANIFSLFTPEEWIQGSSAGRRFVGEFALRSGHA
ncbi:uncharacterized protein K460DRAFT_133460 [Cucurbitaria berberidis CBS 394.84]|uniref:DUF7709 domain-containing protein n=1 Tax=Cucurbitaria berberidis CBS 394.84 TaxID=1168544 RepID=A0A9P4L597_9PLEO|nr:uncharacterized protein K460DRAFT_133460 [Cucurbitaria berberidis CBS 394.84]KAF1842721.1 hypothetical protein K460DRAFT_133460 [Cucurbitaria berberidis CBS 394.84]